MISSATSSRARGSLRNKPALAIGLFLAVAFFAISGGISYRNTRFLIEGAGQVAHTHEVIIALTNVRSLMKDAETGQRGFLLTGNEHYLEPYKKAHAEIDEQFSLTERLVQDNPDQVAMLALIQVHASARLAELEETIQLRRSQGFEAALAVVISDRGKAEMDGLRDKVSKIIRTETELRTLRIAQMAQAYRSATLTGLLTASLGAVLSIITAILLHRTLKNRQRQDWLQTGSMGLTVAVAGDQNLAKIGEQILAFLARYLDAQAGAFFVRQGSHFERVATYGVPAGSDTPTKFGLNDGLLGEAAKQGTPLSLQDVPEGYLALGSGLGRGRPRHLLISPATSDGQVNAVLELGFIHPLDELSLTLLREISSLIGVAVKSANYRTNLHEFLEETQRQGEELQAQSEELRVSNEELEEQGRALRESQARLELQQAELEQINSQLEEQTQMLEGQRDALALSRVAVEAKAEELERVNRYKSDFLANMSHELRTPLNSQLILSKLLADNPGGNLTPEQVRHAQTIQSSGNDLLSLINDILDLSKIEAGHMEVHAESVSVARLIADLNRVFEPVAKQKGLSLTVRVADDCPMALETDRQRVDQILRNLLSNAFKFTEQGGVELTVSPAEGSALAFAVRDTGIGISADNQAAIFDAFRQADGAISRKYGGTGLGLSISRELARLLGGVIRLDSTAGHGSTFTLVLPEILGAELPPPAISASPTVPAMKPAAAAPVPTPRRSAPFTDDREGLTANARVILVVEDDESFARILFDLVRESGFQCLVASTAEDALAIAREYLPNAVLLDVGLPDNSGLSVLDRLKQDNRTRHIPIHVISAGDHAQTALSLGAIGYLVKPVKHEDLVGALRQIEARVAGGQRNVLIVEDDAVQRDSMRQLLGSPEVRAIAVGTASECLEKLRESTFDCMVLDLSLPDASGFSLLETLSKEEAYSFPPVIVYTGRELSASEEQSLRRYSKSIIIKGAKSPERLLDEVTLFLHRVVSDLPAEQQKMIERAQNRDAILEGRRILVVEDDVRNIYALTNILEPRGVRVQIARNGREALEALEKSTANPADRIELVLMDVMMPEMDGLAATRALRERPEWKKLPVIMLTAKAMKNDQERCLDAGANDYMAKPLDVEKLLSLVRVWMPLK